jgi:hypothetical protein
VTLLSPRRIHAGIALLILVQPALCSAQIRIAAGYQYQRNSTALGSNDYPLGLGIAAEHAIARSAWSLVADVGGSESPLNVSVANLVRNANEIRVLLGIQIAVRR